LARKNNINSYKALDNVVVSADVETASTDVSQCDYGSYEIAWSASTLTADVEVQVKNGKNGSWRTLTLSAVPQISGASGSHDITLVEMPFTDIRLALTSVTGSGTVNAVFTAKSKGA
jgi:hypothetical protein